MTEFLIIASESNLTDCSSKSIPLVRWDHLHLLVLLLGQETILTLSNSCTFAIWLICTIINLYLRASSRFFEGLNVELFCFVINVENKFVFKNSTYSEIRDPRSAIDLLLINFEGSSFIQLSSTHPFNPYHHQPWHPGSVQGFPPIVIQLVKSLLLLTPSSHSKFTTLVHDIRMDQKHGIWQLM